MSFSPLQYTILAPYYHKDANEEPLFLRVYSTKRDVKTKLTVIVTLCVGQTDSSWLILSE